MADIAKLSTLLDDPEVRELVLGLAHVGSVAPAAKPGPERLHAIVLSLADTTDPDQYRSWLSDDASNKPMTVEQVRTTIGDDAIDDLAQLASGSPGAVAWQLAAVIPDVVDAVSPRGEIIDAAQLGRAIEEAITYDVRSAGVFGY